MGKTTEGNKHDSASRLACSEETKQKVPGSVKSRPKILKRKILKRSQPNLNKRINMLLRRLKNANDELTKAKSTQNELVQKLTKSEQQIVAAKRASRQYEKRVFDIMALNNQKTVKINKLVKIMETFKNHLNSSIYNVGEQSKHLLNCSKLLNDNKNILQTVESEPVNNRSFYSPAESRFHDTLPTTSNSTSLRRQATVSPMVKGHTIRNPMISLQRLNVIPENIYSERRATQEPTQVPVENSTPPNLGVPMVRLRDVSTLLNNSSWLVIDQNNASQLDQDGYWQLQRQTEQVPAFTNQIENEPELPEDPRNIFGHSFLTEDLESSDNNINEELIEQSSPAVADLIEITKVEDSSDSEETLPVPFDPNVPGPSHGNIKIKKENRKQPQVNSMKIEINTETSSSTKEQTQSRLTRSGQTKSRTQPSDSIAPPASPTVPPPVLENMSQPRKRGRPKKTILVQENKTEQTKKGRGRPRKMPTLIQMR